MKYTMITAMAGIAITVASCTDFSDYNTAPGDFGATGSKTLWQNISENDNLSKFAEIIDKSGFKSNLDAPSFYTVFAPLNGTYNADSVLQILESGLASDTATVLKEFVKQHIVEYNHSVNSTIGETKLLSLNAKSHLFTPYSYGDASFTSDINIPASNGIMHVLNGKEGFYNNIYEYFDKVEGCDLFRDYVKQYDDSTIDESNSVVGGIENGIQTYQYIEYQHSNSVINEILRAKLESEDSSYTVLFPNDEAWNKSYNRILGNYNYVPKLTYQKINEASSAGASIATSENTDDVTLGSPAYLADSLTKKSILTNLAYSHGYPINDVLLTGNGTKEDSVFTTTKHKLVSAQDIDEHTLDKECMANGFVRIVDSIPYQPWQTFEPIIMCQNVARVLPTKDCIATQLYSLKETFKKGGERDTMFKYVPDYFYDRLIGDKSSDSRTFSYVSTISGSDSNIPELDFAIAANDGKSQVLSTKYHIYVLTIPNQILDDVEMGIITKQKPYYLSFYMLYSDANGAAKKQQLYLSENADPSWGPKQVTVSRVNHIVTEPGYAQVIDLGEFEFPACYYNLEAYPTLMMCHTQRFNTATRRDSYEHELRVAGVYLIPVEANEYFIEKSQD